MALCAFVLVACNKAEETHNVAKPLPVSPGSASDANVLKVARENNCTACHEIDKKKVGPAWMDIARKYKGDASAEARLIAKVSKGGSGAWGSVPMPANDSGGTKQEQMKELVQFILSLDK